MLASAGSSPPREVSPPQVLTSEPSPNKPQNRKRKRAPVTAPSPAPSDPGNVTNSTQLIDLLATRNSRPQVSISRDPTFVPVGEGSEFHTTEQIPMNRLGFRYIPAGVVSTGHVLTCRTIESKPTSLRVSWEDRSPFVKVTKDGLGLLGDKGFRSARCNVPVREGRWYMEIKIDRGGGGRLGDSNKHEGSHVRVGWGRREAPLNGPVGLDGYSYGVRDKTGEKVTLSRPRPYGRPFSSGDVIGMYIALPPRRQANKKDPHDPAHLKRERIAIDLRGQEYFEVLEYPQSKEMIALMDYSGKSSNSASVPSSSKKSATVKNLPERGRVNTPRMEVTPLRPIPTLPGSYIAFFINGECQGIAFQDIYDYLQLRAADSSRKGKEKKRNREGTHEHKENPFDDGQLGYYPFISLFNDACVRINPGPDFDYTPPPDIDSVLAGLEEDIESKDQTWRPICERYSEFMNEQWALDAEEEEEGRVESIRRSAMEKAEAEKKAQRNKKRLQAEARKRANKDLPVLTLDDDRFGPTASLSMSGLGQPSPLRYGMAYDADGFGDQANSPAPTIVSSGDIQGVQSGYNSENAEGDGEDPTGDSTTDKASEPPRLPRYGWADSLQSDES